ncbi:rod shape-determining protein MreC [Phenylobacterium terrae]|uniref:Cell shape-determining protein MreC n=2 Tax=Phenylobacterium terrae TaxID=2665495 RepID=A0ABW4N6H4_9CAUL
MSLRDSTFGELKVPLTWMATVAVVIASIVALALLMNDRRGDISAGAYSVTREVGDKVAAPVGGVLSTPLRWVGSGVDTVRGYFFAVSENRRLKAELQEMRQWRDLAVALRDTNDRYKTLLGLQTDPPIPMVAARVVQDSRGPFSQARIANAGREKGIQAGHPVMSEKGLVGRVVGVTDGASRILTLTDIASRTPVMIDRTNARAILTGDGGPNPRLEYLRGHEPVKEGDRVVTSGDGGMLPRGLPVGVAVKGLDGRWRVALASDSAPIDYVRILLFQDFSQLVNTQELNKMTPPPLITAPGAAPPAGAPAAPTPAPPATVTLRPAPAATPPAPAAPRAAPAAPPTTVAPAAAPRPAAPAPLRTTPVADAPATAAAPPPATAPAAPAPAEAGAAQ